MNNNSFRRSKSKRLPSEANFTYFGVMIVMSAQCSDNIDEDILPDVKEIHLKLEATGTGSKENQDNRTQ